MSLLDPNILQGMMLLRARHGETPGLLGGILQFQQQQQQQKLMEEARKQQMEMQRFQMEQQKKQAAEQDQIRQLGAKSFAPNQNLVNFDDQGNPMPSSGGGGMQEFARGMMGIDPMRGVGLMSQLAQQQAPKLQFAPDGTVVDMRRIQPGQSFAKQPEWKDPEYQAFQLRKARAGKTDVTTNVMPPREVFKDSMALKKDFDGQPEVKAFKEVQHGWDQIRTALDNPSAANDLAAATKFMKLLDPGSVVRESELYLAMQASGVLDRFMNLGNRVLQGHKLTPSQRDDFRKSGEALFSAAKSRFGETVGQYQGIAKQYGLDEQFIPKQSRPENLSKNLTATVKARQAIKSGAPREAVIQRLIEHGYDPEGL